MNKDKQQIAIAEACGWRCIWDSREYGKDINGFPPGEFIGGDPYRENIPDYLNDLNAMHEAEKVIKRKHSGGEYLNYLMDGDNPHWARFDDVHKTAAQRAEAFLKTLNLWQDE